MTRIELIDGCNAYYLYYGEECACLGDGVDRESQFEIGTEEFRKEWEDEIKEDWDSYLAAYFPEAQ